MGCKQRTFRAMSTASRLARRVSCAVTALALASVPRAAHADPFQIGAGLIGVAGGNFQDKPDRTYQPDVNPGFGGPTLGGGLMVDARFLDGLLGLEVDAMRTSDHGTGSLDFTNPGVGTLHTKVTIGQPAWHIPILAKITINVPIVAPAFYVGPEIVLPSKASVSVDPSAAAPFFGQTSDTYVMVTFGVGVEIKLPLPVLDLRIPIGLRGGFAPGVSSDFNDRTNINPNPLVQPNITYHSEWKFQAAATLGAAVYF
jgi:hypothetical protein